VILVQTTMARRQDIFFFGGGRKGFKGLKKNIFFRWRKWETIGGMIRGWSWMIPRFDNKSKCVALILEDSVRV